MISILTYAILTLALLGLAGAIAAGRLRLLFAWYDLWVGFFWDSKKRWLYILPVPMFGLILDFSRRARRPLLLPRG